MRFERVQFSHLALLLAIVLTQSVSATKISPEALSFDARLDQPVILTLDVDLEGDTSSKVDITVDGFVCDRRVHALGEGKYQIEIAPDTLIPGSVKGTIQVLVDGKPSGNHVSITGQVLPWLNIRPSRIFLGSIGHGHQFATPKTLNVAVASDTDAFDITTVSFPEIEGASWSCQPEQGIPSLKKTLSLTFSPDAVAAGLPFGALAKKYALVNTSHPEASSFSIPITGMLSVNTTGRDYSTFLYQGQLRWQGPWPTPNIAAAFLSMSMLLLCGVCAALCKELCKIERQRRVNEIGPVKNEQAWHRRLSRPIRTIALARWSIAVLAFALMAGGCLLLAKTYSRGGWVAMALGIAVLWAGSRKARLYPTVLAILFIGAIAINPAGLSRAVSTGAVESDKSIANRLLLWEGALQMMAEHPWQGVGDGKFGEVFARDYQVPTHTQSYSTAINDFLTLGTERGIPVLAIVSTFFLSLAVIAFARGYATNNTFLIACSACIVCAYLVSWFSSVAFQSSSTWLLLASAVAIVVCFAWSFGWDWWKSRRSQSPPTIWATAGFSPLKHLLQFLGIWGVFATLTIVACLLLGQLALRSRPLVESIEIAGLPGLKVTPRGGTPKGTIVYLGDRGEGSEDLLKSTLRPLAARGWSVLCFEPDEFASDARSRITVALDQLHANGQLNGTWCLAGHRRGAAIALCLASLHTPNFAAAYLIPNQLAFAPDLSGFLTSETRPPLLLRAQQTDVERSSLHLKRLAHFAQQSKNSFDEDTYSGDFSHSSSEWQKWIAALDKFLSRSQ